MLHIAEATAGPVLLWFRMTTTRQGELSACEHVPAGTRVFLKEVKRGVCSEVTCQADKMRRRKNQLYEELSHADSCYVRSTNRAPAPRAKPEGGGVLRRPRGGTFAFAFDSGF